MTWLKKLFGMMDRSDAASERIAVALEDMATALETARDRLNGRLGIGQDGDGGGPVDTAAAIGAGAATKANGTGNGRRKVLAG